MTIREARQNDRRSWDAACLHPLQSWAWGDFRKSIGTTVLRLVSVDATNSLVPWQLTYHSVPRTPYSVGYFPKGPAPTTHMLGALREHSARFNAIGIQLEPDVQRITYEHLGHPDGLIPSHRPLFTNYTFIIDLTKTEDALLKAMHHKTRYNIRVAQKHHVTVREDGSQKAFSTFLNLNRETYMRQGFYAHDETYHRTMWDVLSRAGIARLFTAVHEGKILAAWIVFLWKDTLYYPYGASSRINRHVMAPNLLLWELIRWGKSQNLKKFDLWGCLGPDPDPKDPWYGFHRFKEGYAPALVEYAGSFDYPIRPFFYRAYTYADTLRWGLLRLKRQVMHM